MTEFTQQVADGNLSEQSAEYGLIALPNTLRRKEILESMEAEKPKPRDPNTNYGPMPDRPAYPDNNQPPPPEPVSSQQATENRTYGFLPSACAPSSSTASTSTTTPDNDDEDEDAPPPPPGPPPPLEEGEEAELPYSNVPALLASGSELGLGPMPAKPTSSSGSSSPPARRTGVGSRKSRSFHHPSPLVNQRAQRSFVRPAPGLPRGSSESELLARQSHSPPAAASQSARYASPPTGSPMASPMGSPMGSPALDWRAQSARAAARVPSPSSSPNPADWRAQSARYSTEPAPSTSGMSRSGSGRTAKALAAHRVHSQSPRGVSRSWHVARPSSATSVVSTPPQSPPMHSPVGSPVPATLTRKPQRSVPMPTAYFKGLPPVNRPPGDGTHANPDRLHKFNAMLESSLAGQPWYRPGLRRADAEAELAGKPCRSFLVRNSSVPHCLALTHVAADHSVRHLVLEYWDCEERRGWSREDGRTTVATVAELLDYLDICDFSLPK